MIIGWFNWKKRIVESLPSQYHLIMRYDRRALVINEHSSLPTNLANLLNAAYVLYGNRLNENKYFVDSSTCGSICLPVQYVCACVCVSVCEISRSLQEKNKIQKISVVFRLVIMLITRKYCLISLCIRF